MTGAREGVRAGSAVSADGTSIGYCSLGAGPGLIVVGGVLSTGSSYMPLGRILAEAYEVHLMDRRGRPSSGPQRPSHCIEDECADLTAVASRTGAAAVFGHSFGGLVALETARRQPIFDQLFVYEPGVPIRGQFQFNWLDGYERLLKSGDRRGAFAWMVKHNGFAPTPLAVMPLWCIRAMLRLAIRSREWDPMDRLLEANLVEHRIEAALDAPDVERFSTITARTVLMGGTKSPAFISQQLVTELAAVIPNATVAILPELDHRAAQQQPSQIATTIHPRHSPREQPPSPGGGPNKKRVAKPADAPAALRDTRAPAERTDGPIQPCL
jgi:pimeloyl-ACP methyl ester carboxylesterase